MQGWFNLRKSNDLIQYINRTEDKNTHMIISIDAEKAFDKIPQTHFHDKNNQLGIQENFLIMITGIYEKPTTNILLNDKRLKVFSL